MWYVTGMPTENDKPTVGAPASEDLKDTKDLKAQEEIKKLKAELESLKKAPKETRDTVPAGDYAVIGGKTYQVEGTVSAKFAGDEGRKGHLPDGLETELAILKR